MFQTPLPVARAMLALMAALFLLSVIEGIWIFAIHATWGLFLAGYLVGDASQTSRR